MIASKRNIFTIILLILIYGWFTFSQLLTPKPTPLNISGASQNLTLFTQPESGRTPILNAINSAQKEILVEVYLLSDKDIIKALENAKKRGVIVNVMAEQHPFGGGNLNNESSKDLINNNISFKWANPAFSLTHEKAIVIDNKIVFILSQNLTASSFSKNREYDILDTNQADVVTAREIFINDWERKNFVPTKNSNLIICPINCRNAITTLASSVKNSIDIEMEVIQDARTIALLSDLAKKAKVRIIVPTLSQIDSNRKALSDLKSAGVSIRTLSSPYIHAKLIIVDNKKAYLGSVNLTTQSMDQNREIGIILVMSQAITSLSKAFEVDWQKGTPF